MVNKPSIIQVGSTLGISVGHPRCSRPKLPVEVRETKETNIAESCRYIIYESGRWTGVKAMYGLGEMVDDDVQS